MKRCMLMFTLLLITLFVAIILENRSEGVLNDDLLLVEVDDLENSLVVD